MTGALPHVPDFHHFSMAFRSYVHIPGRRRKHQTLSRVAEHCVTSADRESLVELPANVAGDDDRSGGQPITGEHVPIFYANRSEHESRECTMIISQTLCVRIGTAYRTLPRLQREESKARRIEDRQAGYLKRTSLAEGLAQSGPPSKSPFGSSDLRFFDASRRLVQLDMGLSPEVSRNPSLLQSAGRSRQLSSRRPRRSPREIGVLGQLCASRCAIEGEQLGWALRRGMHKAPIDNEEVRQRECREGRRDTKRGSEPVMLNHPTHRGRPRSNP